MHYFRFRSRLSKVGTRHRSCRAALGLGLGFVAYGLTALGVTVGGAAGSPTAAVSLPAHWVPYRHLAGVVDIAGPRGDGSFSVAAAGRLFLLDRSGVVRPFARGGSGYSTAKGPEPYITVGGAAGGGASG